MHAHPIACTYTANVNTSQKSKPRSTSWQTSNEVSLFLFVHNRLHLVVKLLQVRLQNLITDHSLKIETLRGRTLTEMHELLQEMCSESKLDHSLISHLSQRFCQGQGSVNNKECTGRLRTSTGNTTAAVIATILEEDRYMTVKR